MEIPNKSIKVTKAIQSIKPNSNFIVGETYSSLIWDSKDQTKPTEKEFNDAVIAWETEYDANQYQRDREYPALGEQLDMLFHDMTAGKGSKDGEWYKAVAKVKADNPKPE